MQLAYRPPDVRSCTRLPFSSLIRKVPPEGARTYVKLAIPLDVAFRAGLRASHSMFPVTMHSMYCIAPSINHLDLVCALWPAFSEATFVSKHRFPRKTLAVIIDFVCVKSHQAKPIRRVGADHLDWSIAVTNDRARVARSSPPDVRTCITLPFSSLIRNVPPEGART